MKIVFPPSTSQNHTATPILSLGVLKSYLKTRGISTEIEDLEILVKYKKINLHIFQNIKVVLKYLLQNAHNDELSTTVEQILNLTSFKKFDMVGFSIMGIRQFFISLCLASRIKERYGTRIILGGFYPQSNAINIMKNFSFIDYIVEKEGEIPLEMLLKGENKKNIPFLYYREKGRIKKSNVQRYVNINDLPTPDFEGLPFNVYKKYLNYLEIPYELSRGCIANCNFCSFPRYGGLRVKPVEKIMKDLNELKKKYKTTRFIFYSAEININKKWSQKFLRSLTVNKPRIKWIGYLVPTIDEDIARLLKSSNCQEVKVGIESGNDEILKKMGKIHSVKDAAKTINLLSKYGINAYYFFIVGYLYENKKQFYQTVNFILEHKSKIKKARVTIFELEYNTKIFENPHKHGIKPREWEQNLLLPTMRLPFDEIDGLKWEDKFEQQMTRRRQIERIFKKHNIKIPRDFC